MKRVSNDLKGDYNDLKEKNTELQKAVDDKTGEKALDLLRGENDSLIKKAQKSNDEWKSKYDLLEKSGVQMKILNQFDRSLTGVKFKDEAIIPLDVRNAMINNAKTELVQTASFVEDELVFLGPDGKILRDDNLNVLTAADILSEKLKSIIDVGRKAAGVNIEDDAVTKDEDGKSVVNLSLPDSVKTNADLSDFLLEYGLKRGSEDYNAAYAKFRDKLKIVT